MYRSGMGSNKLIIFPSRYFSEFDGKLQHTCKIHLETLGILYGGIKKKTDNGNMFHKIKIFFFC